MLLSRQGIVIFPILISQLLIIMLGSMGGGWILAANTLSHNESRNLYHIIVREMVANFYFLYRYVAAISLDMTLNKFLRPTYEIAYWLISR